VPLCPPRMPHYVTRARTGAAAMGSLRDPPLGRLPLSSIPN
jgi:hypothetical protein